MDYNDPLSLVEAFQDQEVLTITLSVFAPHDQQTKLILAAAAANVAWVIPNELAATMPTQHRPITCQSTLPNTNIGRKLKTLRKLMARHLL